MSSTPRPPNIGEEIILLPDGTYTFTNLQYNTSLNMYNYAATAPITGLGTQTPQEWTLKNIKNNLVTIQNKSTNSYVAPSTELAQDITIIGSSVPYKWVAKRYPGTTDTIYFVTDCGEYTWFLTSNGNYAVVVLKDVTDDIDDASLWVRATAPT